MRMGESSDDLLGFRQLAERDSHRSVLLFKALGFTVVKLKTFSGKINKKIKKT